MMSEYFGQRCASPTKSGCLNILRATPPAAGPLRYGPTEAPRWSQRGTNMVPKMLQNGPKDAPTWPQRCPKMAQNGSKRSQDGLRRPQDGPSPNLGAILGPFWLQFGTPFGFQKHPKIRFNFNTISDVVLGPNLEPFWDQNWSYLGVMWGMC